MNSRNEGEENSETIPLDLIIEILTRLPTRSIARFRCVSKLWESTLRSLNFAKSFLTLSSSRPKLLFKFVKDGKTIFFTSPQPQNSSSTLTASFHKSFAINYQHIGFCRPVHGLVYGLNHHTVEGELVAMPLICNPSSGQSLPLPKVKIGYYQTVRSYLGFDPIDKQFKVLCMTLSFYRPEKFCLKEQQVLTLGPGKQLSWRMIKCDLPHIPIKMERLYGHCVDDYICINGVLYYIAQVQGGDEYHDIVCFGIRSEEFKCIRHAQGMGATSKSFLVNYKGKLAMLQPNDVNGIYTCIQLWVLEDAEKHQWSRYIYVLPPHWNIIYEEKMLYFVGMTNTGEIVLSPNNISNSFYLLYYNPERNTVKKVGIQGMGAFKHHNVYTFLDHVEDVKLMEVV